MKTAFIFPGQGSQFPGMGQDLARDFSVARDTFETADQALGFALSELCFQGPQEQLQLTENTQPAILAVSVAAWRVISEAGVSAEMVAGHSLGEYSALVAAGSLDFGDALRVVRQRGQFMQEAVPVGVGAMAAVLGLEESEVSAVCLKASQTPQVVAPANLNAPGQVVIAGHAEAVQRAGELAREAGARRVIPLPVSAPFHCPLMAPAQERLAQVLAQTHFSDLEVPLVNNVDALVVQSGEEAREGLVRQVTGSVRWTDVVRQMQAHGVTRFLEIGPGRVLSGLVRKIAPESLVEAVGSATDMEQYV